MPLVEISTISLKGLLGVVVLLLGVVVLLLVCGPEEELDGLLQIRGRNLRQTLCCAVMLTCAHKCMR